MKAVTSGLLLVLAACSAAPVEANVRDAAASDASPLDAGPKPVDASPPPKDAPAEVGPVSCSAPPPALAAHAWQFASVDFHEGAPLTVGFNLDGKCSTPQSLDVCDRAKGATSASITDGPDGRDNNWGKSLVPILASAFSLANPSAAVSAFPSYLVVDAQGEGSVVFYVDAETPLVIPLRAAHVTESGGVGEVGATIDAEVFIARVEQIARKYNPVFCTAGQFDGVAQTLRQAVDMMSDGTNGPGAACNGVSIGFTFNGATAYKGTLPAPAIGICK